MEQAGNLSDLGFKQPPFELGRFDVQRVGREAEWNRLVTIYRDSIRKPSSTIAVLLGSYGTGKTFLLTKLRDLLNSENEAFANRPVRFLDPESKKNYIKNIVINTFRRGIDIENDLLPIIEDAIPHKIDISLTYDPFIKLLLLLGSPDTFKIAFRVLTGGKILRSEAQKNGLDDLLTINSNEDAFNLLMAFQIVLHWAGRNTFVWMIDEVEYIDQLADREQTSAIDSLKDIWDRQADLASRSTFRFASLLLFLAATPSFWQNKKKLVSESNRGAKIVGLVPFFARVQDSNVVEIPSSLDPDEAEKLIISRMTSSRDGQQPSNPIIPFTDTYIDYVFEVSGGVPRKIIEICDTVLSEAVSKGVKLIDREVAKRLLSSLMITYEAPAGTLF